MQEMTHRITKELHKFHSENHDNCVLCGYRFYKGDTAHLGYGHGGKLLYVCDRCSCQLIETAVRYYFEPRRFEIPDESSKLWRYMDFTKYVSLLASKSVYFSRADCFDDVFEGAKGYERNKSIWDAHHISFFREALTNLPEGISIDTSEEKIDEDSLRLLSELRTLSLSSRERVFISCWHENEHESEAMWRLYSKIWDNAVAIRTTYKRLKDSLSSGSDVSIGRVKYIDMRKEFAGVNNAFWRKRKSFEHEREVRALVFDWECKDKGKLIECDLDTLVEQVYVSPKAPIWFVDLVNDVNKKYSLNIVVSSSEIDEAPLF